MHVATTLRGLSVARFASAPGHIVAFAGTGPVHDGGGGSLEPCLVTPVPAVPPPHASTMAAVTEVHVGNHLVVGMASRS